MMETETILAELSKINSRLDEICDRLEMIALDMTSCKETLATSCKETLARNAKCDCKGKDKYSTWPLDADLDIEEAKENLEARNNASVEWKALKQAEQRTKYMLDEIQEQR